MQPFEELKRLLARREERIPQRVPVCVWGMDNQKKAFVQITTTLDVSEMGARLDNVKYWDAPGQTIGVSCGPEKARFKVVWIGTEGPRAGQAGLKCLQRGKMSWNPEATPKQPPSAESAAAKLKNERRQQSRYDCLGGIHLREPDKDTAIFGTLTQISLGGCFLKTANPLPLGTVVQLEVGANFLQFSAMGTVRCLQSDGMAVQFDSIQPEQMEELKLLIISLQEPDAFYSSAGSA